MKFSIHRTALFNKLASLQGVVERKSTIPILSYLRIGASVKSGDVTLFGTDLDVSLSRKVDADVTQEGACCLPAKKLFEIVRILPDAEVSFVEKDGHVTITCEKSRFKLAALDADSFPEMPTSPDVYTPVPLESLRDMIAKTSYAITNEESRYTLNGAKFEMTADVMRMVATDGHRLALTEKAGNFAIAAPWDVLIPKKCLAEMGKVLDNLEVAEMALSENHLFICAGDAVLVTRLLSGQFPQWQMVVPKDQPLQVTANTERLTGAIKRVSLMADSQSKGIVMAFHFESGEVAITAPASENGDASESASITVNRGGDMSPVSLAASALYLLEALDKIDSEDVIIEIKDGYAQILIRPAVEEDATSKAVIMPMRL